MDKSPDYFNQQGSNITVELLLEKDFNGAKYK